ncbi:hypothetical protein CKA32_005289 [Geitlerinema sp. FC II]|nr:hypothetical protein CKA32_005289 [Geitlerinema sp. FC II]
MAAARIGETQENFISVFVVSCVIDIIDFLRRANEIFLD